MFKFLGISIAAAIIVPSVAFATPVSLTRSQHVSYADLDLTTASGQTEFRHRVRDAIGKVCRFNDTAAFTLDEVVACRQTAWLDAKRQMNAVTQLAMRDGAPAVLAGR